MFQIEKRITVNCSSSFSVEENIVNSQIKRVNGEFTCCSCGFVNGFSIVPYVSGYPVLRLYQTNMVLSEKELIDNKMVAMTSAIWSHLGRLTVDDLPTLYFGTTCASCGEKYISLFGCGEKQPGLSLLKISGFWCYSEL